MSPYTIFPTFSFLENVYRDGFRIIIYKVSNDINNKITHKLFPYEAIFEDGSYIKNHTKQNQSNYVYYYDIKYLIDSEYAVQRNNTFIDTNKLIKCNVYDFNIDELKSDLLKKNNIDIHSFKGNIDDLINELYISVYFDRTDDNIRYYLSRQSHNGKVMSASKYISTSIEDTKYMSLHNTSKFAVKLEYVDAYECFKNSIDKQQYIDLKKNINKYLFKFKDTTKDWICDDKIALAKLIKYGLPLEFAYKAINIENMVFIVEDIYRTCENNVIYGPIYKTFLD